MEHALRVVVVGDGAVGKTSLLQNATNDFSPRSQFETYTFLKTINGKAVSIQLRDTAGQDDWDQTRILSYADVGAVLICFSVISPPSYEHVRSKWMEERNRFSPETPIILVGTKKDLREDQEILRRLSARGLSPITLQQGKALAKEIGAARYAEVACTAAPELQALLTDCLGVALKRAKAQNGCELI